MNLVTTLGLRVRYFSRIAWLGIFAVGLSVASATPPSPVVMTIDYSNLSAVKFTATGAAPLINYSGSLGMWDGIALLNFLTSPTVVQDFVTAGPVTTYNGSTTGGGLTDSSNTAGSGKYFTDLSTWNDANPGFWGGYGEPGTGSGVDLTLWNNNNGTGMIFSTGSASFYGEATFDLSSFGSITALFPTLGATGNVGLWNGNGTLGTWQVVGTNAIPEPSTYAAIFGAVALLGVAARRRLQRTA